jgi:Sec-independent protein translocase protein TatA
VDGIFGVGLAEMLIIGLALFIIGGPENTARWARELGRAVRKVRQSWDAIMAEVERELGPEGKELVEVTRELNQTARQLRSKSSARGVLSDATRLLDNTRADIEALDKKPVSDSTPDGKPVKSTSNGSYAAWLPPEDDQTK